MNAHSTITAAAEQATERPHERVHRLTRELSQALADSLDAGEILADMATVFPAGKPYPISFCLDDSTSGKFQRLYGYESAFLAKQADPSNENKYAAKLALQRLQACFKPIERRAAI